MWDFETDPEYQQKLDWVERFMVDEVEPLDLVELDPYDKNNPETMAVLRPLQQKVKDEGLWAAHLRPELGGQGYGQVKLALLNEIIGRSRWAPSVFGSQAPDSGNAEILALFGTDAQKKRYLQPLLDGEISSCYSMTEPQGGSDPGLFVTSAQRDGDSWVINGEKWFSTNARHATFFIVMAVTNPDARTREKMSLFIVPAETPGIEIVRHVGVGWARGRVVESWHPRLRSVHRRAGARRPRARWRGPGVRDRADPTGRWPGAPRHAHYRAGEARIRHDV